MTIRPEIFLQENWLIAGMSTRQGGVSSQPLGMNLSFNVGDDAGYVRRNRELFFGAFGVGQNELAVPGQVHGTAVREIENPGPVPETDGLVTSRHRLFLCVTVADCVPILMADPSTRSVAAVHAGWRGTAGRIVQGALGLLSDRLGVRPGDLLVYIGPSAGACCYAVGDEVASMFPASCLGRVGGKQTVDLKLANLNQLRESGVRAEHVEISPFCTISEPHLFHSHRREASASGRMMAFIGKTRV